MSKTGGRSRCKIVSILLADKPYYYEEVVHSVKNNIPIIVVKGKVYFFRL